MGVWMGAWMDGSLVKGWVKSQMKEWLKEKEKEWASGKEKT